MVNNLMWDDKLNKMEEILIEILGVSEDSISLVCAAAGRNPQTFENVLFYLTGWRDFDGFMEEMEG